MELLKKQADQPAAVEMTIAAHARIADKGRSCNVKQRSIVKRSRKMPTKDILFGQKPSADQVPALPTADSLPQLPSPPPRRRPHMHQAVPLPVKPLVNFSELPCVNPQHPKQKFHMSSSACTGNLHPISCGPACTKPSPAPVLPRLFDLYPRPEMQISKDCHWSLLVKHLAGLPDSVDTCEALVLPCAHTSSEAVCKRVKFWSTESDSFPLSERAAPACLISKVNADPHRLPLLRSKSQPGCCAAGACQCALGHMQARKAAAKCPHVVSSCVCEPSTSPLTTDLRSLSAQIAGRASHKMLLSNARLSPAIEAPAPLPLGSFLLGSTALEGTESAGASRRAVQSTATPRPQSATPSCREQAKATCPADPEGVRCAPSIVLILVMSIL